MNNQLIAKVSIKINAQSDKVWDALTNPEIIKKYMFGTTAVSDWRVGSQIIWKGDWQGKKYEDKGKILKLEKGKIIQYSHLSPRSGKSDTPENYHTVSIELSADGNKTIVELSQDNNETEKVRDHSEKNWQMMLESLTLLMRKPRLHFGFPNSSSALKISPALFGFFNSVL